MKHYRELAAWQRATEFVEEAFLIPHPWSLPHP